MLDISPNKILHWVGNGLSVLGIAFVVVKLAEYGDQLALDDLEFWDWIILLTLALSYGLSGMLLALAWRDLLRYLGVSVRRRWAIGAYGVSQLAKYVPGNIFHLAGRQAIGAAAGIPGRLLAKSSLWELGTISITGSLFGFLVFPLLISSLTQILVVGIFLAVLLTSTMIALRWSGAPVSRAICWYAAFLALSGLVFMAVLALIATPNPSFTVNIPSICGAYVIAWLAGLVTPGAPAGVGIREVVLYALLHILVSQTDLLTTILLARMVTVAGDMFFYLFALVLFNRQTDLIANCRVVATQHDQMLQ